MTAQIDPRRELDELVGRFRHLREEHRRAPAGGRARRRLVRELRDAEEHAERRILALVDDPEVRAGWAAHLHHGAAAPELPVATAPVARASVPDRPEGRRPWPR